ncbi:MAG: dihydrodipicolinate synthase family protein [Gammaproteobacteria bacterium]|jgi:4-hydroxy-tetrahydrodipicolinate synthase|nr:dihydrodipicolinate synthase family protein [Gammaproteobacteria bacterium]
MHDKQILVPIVTPFNDRMDVCRQSVVNIMSRLYDHAYGVVPCLTSGEGWCLDSHQWSDMVRYCVSNAGGLKVIAGIEKATTAEVLRFVKIAQSLGVDGVMLTTPFGKNVTQPQMLEHFREVHHQSECDLWIYHEQPLSNNLLTLESLLAISSLPRVTGIKDSGEDHAIIDNIERFDELNVKVYHGWENRLVIGEKVTGNIVSLSNLEPAICQQATRCVSDLDLQSKIDSLCEKFSLTEVDWYRHVKNELWQRGVISTQRIAAEPS